MTALPLADVALPTAEVSPPTVTTPPPLQLVSHTHTWNLIADEYDGYGHVRLYECPVCDAVQCL